MSEFRSGPPESVSGVPSGAVPGNAGPGRPRDPGLEDRVHDAALEVFADRGWGAFSVAAVARAAGVGKASIYLRWSDKEELLLDALRARLRSDDVPDSGDLRRDLLALVSQSYGNFTSPSGRAVLRMFVDGTSTPGLRERYAEFARAQTVAARGLVRRAIDDGRLPPTTSVTALLEMVLGAALFHVLSTPPELRDVVADRSQAHLETLVDQVLRAAGHAGPAGSRDS